jgi:hypothetical protein
MQNYELELSNHFDLLLPNREFKLVIGLESNPGEMVTVYFDTRYSLHQFCILPGMKVNVFNLIRKNECKNEFRSNTNLSVAFEQDLNLFDYDLESNSKALSEMQDSIKLLKKRTIFDNLNELDTIFECFYFRKEFFQANQSSDELRLDASYRQKILFNNEKSTTSGSLVASKDAQCFKILAQIVRVYEFCIRIKCRQCGYLASACHCNGFKIGKQIDVDKCRVEVEFVILIDDHTSLLKCNFTDLDFDLKK